MLNLECFTIQKNVISCNIKDKVLHDQRNLVIYKINCPGCNGCYIGKSERYLILLIIEHGTKETEPMFKHFFKC